MLMIQCLNKVLLMKGSNGKCHLGNSQRWHFTCITSFSKDRYLTFRATFVTEEATMAL